jgi:hypothetical protein
MRRGGGKQEEIACMWKHVSLFWLQKQGRWSLTI